MSTAGKRVYGRPFTKNDPTTGERDERINRAGAPKRGASLAEVLAWVDRQNVEDILQLIPAGSDLARDYKNMPKGLPMNLLKVLRLNAAIMFDPNPALVRELHMRTDGIVTKTDTGGTINGLRIGGRDGRFTLPADVLAPSFLDAHRDIVNGRHTEYILSGGRGSTKSSFVSLELISLLINNPNMHAVAMRQVKDTLRDSVYSQLVWAISELGLSDDFNCTTSPLEIEYKATGQKVYFRGADDPGKIKSIKPAFGYIGILWFEELDQFHGPEAVRKIEQSVIRGGDEAKIFKTFNPPPTANNWANKYIQIPKESQYQHRSDYRTVPPEWLGKTFIDEAEHLQRVNPKAYNHEYLGEANSDGGAVFPNLKLRAITDDEIKEFDRVLHGLDWGFYPDPAHYSRVHYDAARRVLYVYGESRHYKLSNEQLWNSLQEYGLTKNDLLIADSAEPKSVQDFRAYGSNCRGAEKGKESVAYSVKWLQGLTEIVIDPVRCPYSSNEFQDYEYERTKDGEIISALPDANNHAIDSVRYATNLIWRRKGE
jgi:PBSX family phage terminase large subunit